MPWIISPIFYNGFDNAGVYNIANCDFIAIQPEILQIIVKSYSVELEYNNAFVPKTGKAKLN